MLINAELSVQACSLSLFTLFPFNNCGISIMRHFILTIGRSTHDLIFNTLLRSKQTQPEVEQVLFSNFFLPTTFTIAPLFRLSQKINLNE